MSHNHQPYELILSASRHEEGQPENDDFQFSGSSTKFGTVKTSPDLLLKPIKTTRAAQSCRKGIPEKARDTTMGSIAACDMVKNLQKPSM
jgi:hypothetical protein